MKFTDIADATKISKECIGLIGRENFSMQKLCERRRKCMPREFAIDRFTVSKTTEDDDKIT